MNEYEPVVIIIEDNATRAELYELWLDECEVRIALTKRQVADAVDEDVSVAVLAEEFGDGAGPDVLELLAERVPTYEVVTTAADRTKTFPDLDVDHHLTEPVFKDELRELVTRLVGKNRYRRYLAEYFERTTQLASIEVKESSGEGTDERRAALQERVGELKSKLDALGRRLSTEDAHDVVSTLAERRDRPVEDENEDTSGGKYAPQKCTDCGTRWRTGPGDDLSRGYRKLGSYVWRCVECGHVQMQTDPSHQRLAPYQ